MVEGDKLYAAHAGDCRAILCRGDRAVDLTSDHSYENARERTRVHRTCADPRPFQYFSCAYRLGGHLEPSRALGDYFLVDPKYAMDKHRPYAPYLSSDPDVYVGEVDRTRDKFLVLASDGLWNCMESQAVVDFVLAYLRQMEEHADHAAAAAGPAKVAKARKASPARKLNAGVSSTQLAFDADSSEASDQRELDRAFGQRAPHARKPDSATEAVDPEGQSTARSGSPPGNAPIMTRLQARRLGSPPKSTAGTHWHLDANLSQLLIDKAKEKGPTDDRREFDDQCVMVYLMHHSEEGDASAEGGQGTEWDLIQEDLQSDIPAPAERWQNFKIQVL